MAQNINSGTDKALVLMCKPGKPGPYGHLGSNPSPGELYNKQTRKNINQKRL